MCKNLYITFVFLVSIHICGFGQEGHSRKQVPQISLFADAGIKKLQFTNLVNELNRSNISAPSSSYFIGASTYYNSSNMIFGLEFNNAFGRVSNASGIVWHNGLSAGGQVGYKVLKKQSFALAPILGLSTNTNIVSVSFVSSSQKNNSLIYKTRDYLFKGGLFFEYITPVNMSFGIKAGYDFSLNQAEEWGIVGSPLSTTLIDTRGGFFVSLIIGGHVLLKSHI